MSKTYILNRSSHVLAQEGGREARRRKARSGDGGGQRVQPLSCFKLYGI